MMTPALINEEWDNHHEDFYLETQSHNMKTFVDRYDSIAARQQKLWDDREALKKDAKEAGCTHQRVQNWDRRDDNGYGVWFMRHMCRCLICGHEWQVYK